METDDTTGENHDMRPKLDGLSDTVKRRFYEVDETADYCEDCIILLDNMEKALVGIMMNSSGHPVAVYERGLCIACLIENYGDDWAKSYDYTDEQRADEDFMREEVYNMAVEDFEYNTLRSIPYWGDRAPVIIEGFMVDADKWEALRNA